MTQNNKICLNFETGEEVKDVMITLDGKAILFINIVKKLITSMNDIIMSLLKEEEINGQEPKIEAYYFNKSTDSNPIFQKYPLLLELQKKLGFNVYGEYVVLNDDIGEMLIYEAYHNSILSREYEKEYNRRGIIYKNSIRLGGNSFSVDEVQTEVEDLLDMRGLEDISLHKVFGYVQDGRALYILKQSENNIIQELSKHYRGEENKFEEFRNILGL